MKTPQVAACACSFQSEKNKTEEEVRKIASPSVHSSFPERKGKSKVIQNRPDSVGL